jgi:SAM-dependent methyltransferase
MEGIGILQDVLGSWTARIILVANKLGVFEAIGKGKATPKEIAKKIKVKEDPLTRLLNTLVGLSYLEKRNEMFSNSQKTRVFLLSDSPKYIGNFLNHMEDGINEHYGFLETLIKTDKAPVAWDVHMSRNPLYWRHYTYGMLDLAKLETPEILKNVTLPKNVKKLLDIGGAHGWHSMAFCKKYPGLTAVVLDLPLSAKFGKEIVKSQKMQDRISFRIGDCTKDDIGSDYDVALLFGSLIQGYPPEITLKIFKNVYRSLRPKGTFILKIFCVSEDRTKPFGAVLYNLLIRIGLSKYGRTYTFREVKDLLGKAGFRKITKKDMSGSNIIRAIRN